MHHLYYWKFAFEIAILWYAIYMILSFVKGTRTEQLLKGLVVIGLMFILTRQLGLHTINWVLGKVFPISVFALLVIFQPELRRGLARLGQLGLREENVDILDEVAGAAFGLSAKKTGGLIVLERAVGLKSYVESGTKIDGVVTSLLIETIFITQSDLHDGACIIEHGRLAAAGCILPITQEREGLPKSFGLRHRAAIGITEETDAVCVVISEESRTVSMADSGNVTKVGSEAELSKRLKEIFRKPVKKGSFFK